MFLCADANACLNGCFSVLWWTAPTLLASFYCLGSKPQHHSQVFHIGNALFLYTSINPSKSVSSSDIIASPPASNPFISRSFIVKSFFLRQRAQWYIVYSNFSYFPYVPVLPPSSFAPQTDLGNIKDFCPSYARIQKYLIYPNRVGLVVHWQIILPTAEASAMRSSLWWQPTTRCSSSRLVSRQTKEVGTLAPGSQSKQWHRARRTLWQG